MENKEGSQGREGKGHEEEGSRKWVGGGRDEGERREEKQEIKNIISNPNHQVVLHTSAPKYD